VVGLEGASSSEFEPDSKYPVIATMEEQLDIVDGKGDLGGTMRLGLYEAKLDEGSVIAETYGTTKVSERHRHRYEVNNKDRDQIAAKGLVFSGTSPDGKLVEYVELPRDVHPYYVATQAHPELSSRPTRPHPLFAGLVKAALDHQKGGDLFPVANGAETKSAEVTSAEAPAGAGGSARKVSAK
jgi:CTP synthase